MCRDLSYSINPTDGELKAEFKAVESVIAYIDCVSWMAVWFGQRPYACNVYSCLISCNKLPWQKKIFRHAFHVPFLYSTVAIEMSFASNSPWALNFDYSKYTPQTIECTVYSSWPVFPINIFRLNLYNVTILLPISAMNEFVFRCTIYIGMK